MDLFEENAQFSIVMNPNIRMLNLPPGVPRQKQTRRRQPHRKAPSARSGKRKERGDAEESRGARENRAARGDEKSEHSEKMERQAAAFDANRPRNVEEFVVWAPNKIEFRKLVTQTMQGLYQQQVNGVVMMMRQGHSCCLGGAHPDTTFENKKVLSVAVITAERNFVLQVPTLQCKMCKKQLTVHPYSVNCGPTSPTDACETWITDECLHLFRDLHTQNGLSAGAWVHGMENTKTALAPQGDVLLNSQNEPFTATLKKEQLITATQEHWKVEYSATDFDELNSDPFQHCFICAETGREKLNSGIAVPEYKVQVSTDAMNSANKFKSAGRAQSDIKPSTDLYLSEVAQNVIEKQKNGDLSKSATERAKPQDDAIAHAEQGTLPACTTALSCNRESSSSKRAEMEFTGQVAVVCSHIFPGLGLAVGMTTPEQHIFYDMVLTDALKRMSHLGVIFLDLMCRYHVRFTGLVRELIERGVVREEARDIRLLLPWMHGFDHDMDCQIKFSGLYAEGVGRRVGEQTESWWAKTKPYAKIARYMTFAHWWDGYNMLYHTLTRCKQMGLAGTLESKLNKIDTKIDGYRKEVERLKAEAASRGVHDLDSAMNLLQQDDEENSRPKLSVSAQYVQALMALRSHEGIDAHRAALPLHLPGNTGIHLHAKAGDVAVKKKLSDAVFKLMPLLPELPAVEFGEHWAEDLPEYTEGLAELRKHLMKDIQVKIELQVFKRKLILYDLEQNSSSSKNRSHLQKRKERVNTNISDQLSMYYTWEVMGTSATPKTATQERLRPILEGTFPWEADEDGGNGEHSAQRHYGAHYRTAINQLRRTEEEKVILNDEVIRLFNRLEEVSAALEDRIQDQTVISHMTAPKEATDISDVAESGAVLEGRAKKHNLAEGRAVLLNVELQRVKLIWKDAANRLRKHFPAASTP